jgi:hypothetical protein
MLVRGSDLANALESVDGALGTTRECPAVAPDR